MGIRGGLICTVLLGLHGSASAQSRVCEYETSQWDTDVGAIEAALTSANLKEARILIELHERQIECLSAPVPPHALARYGQIRAYVAFHQQDDVGATRWARLAEQTSPATPWPAWVPPEHPVREILAWADPTELVGANGKGVAHPKKGAVLVNGRMLSEPTVPADTPLLVQIHDAKGARLESFWHDGPLPPRLLADAPVTARAPKWLVVVPEPAREAPAIVAAVEPPEPVVEPPVPVVDAPAPEPEPVATAPEAPARPAAPSRSDLGCPDEPVTVASIAELSAQATDAFANTDRERFDATYDDLRVRIPCLAEVMAPAEAAVVHRLFAFRAFVAGDDQATLRSMQVAQQLDPAYALPESIAPPGGPLHQLYERGRENPDVARVGFGEPDGLSGYVDGSASARRPISAPTFLQLRTEDGDVHWSAYLTPEDPLPAWLPSVKEAVLASVGAQVVDEFKALRVAQETRREQLTQARADVLGEAERAFTEAATAARAGDDSGRAALEAFVSRYDDASVAVGDAQEAVVVPQVAAARAWLKVYADEQAEEKVAAHAAEVEQARDEVRDTARTDWQETEVLIAQADYESDRAVFAFIERYDGARVEVSDAVEPVFVPQVDTAKDWAQIYTLAKDKLPDTSDSLKIVLDLAEERRTVDTSVMQRIARETTALLGRAREDWETAMAVAERDDAAGRIAVERFIGRYSAATIDIDGEVVAVDVPEVPIATAWLAGPPAAPVEETVVLGPTKRGKRIGAAVGFGAAGAGLYGASWVSRLAYDHDRSNAMFYTTNGIYAGSAVLSSIALGYFISALTTPKEKR